MTMRRSPGGLVATTLAAIAVFGLGRFSAPSSVSSDVSGRLYLKVSFDVKPERRGDFLAAIRANEKGTNKEPLNRAYLWGEDTETPNRFHFHEEYQGSAGFEAHLASAHVAAWDAFVATDPFTAPIDGPLTYEAMDVKSAGGMSPIAYSLAIASAFCNAIFFTPNRLESVKAGGVHPIIYNWYTTAGVFLFSWLVAFTMLPSAGLEPVTFTPAGFAGGALFTCALCFSCLALDQIGLSLALGIWCARLAPLLIMLAALTSLTTLTSPTSRCGMATLVSFLWGTIGPPNIARPLADVPFSLAGISLIILGILGIINVEDLGKCFFGKCCGDKSYILMGGAGANGEDAAPPAASGSRFLGTVYAIAVGLFGGSMLVPLSYLPAEFSGIKGLGFIPSFGTGSLIAGTFFALVLRICAGPQTLAPEATLWAGLVSGSIWQFGNVCQVIAQSYYHLPYAISYPIFQASLVFGGFLGIVLFKEIKGASAIAFFYLSSVAVVGGASLLALFGPVSE